MWHNDYEKTNTIMIPLVDQTCETATQIIEYPLKQKPKKSSLGYESDYGDNILDILDK